MQICIYFRNARPPSCPPVHTVSFSGQQSGLHSSKTGLFYWKTNIVQSPATYWLPSTAMTITIDMLIETVRCLMPLLISFILLILTLLSMWLHVVQCWKAFATPITTMGRRQCLPFSWTPLRGKHCRRPIAVMGFAHAFVQCRRTAGTLTQWTTYCNKQWFHRYIDATAIASFIFFCVSLSFSKNRPYRTYGDSWDPLWQKKLLLIFIGMSYESKKNAHL